MGNLLVEECFGEGFVEFELELLDGRALSGKFSSMRVRGLFAIEFNGLF